MANIWKPGETVVWRGIFRNRVWHAVPSFVIKDTLQELVLAVIPGTNCMVEENYAKSRKDGKRHWDFKDKDWLLEEFTWHTNRVLTITESEKYYSIMLFWNHARNEFLGYYVNFQLPFQRSHCGIDSLDLDLDIVIEPDLSFRWKDEDDYQKAIEQGILIPEWVQNIENAKPEIMERLEKRQYPFDDSWLNWRPDSTWSPPTLPENWDKI
jgi:predicted RNA-binding protein associated with RNAse of E/G family